MGNTNLILFLTASVVVILAPGPDNILVLTRGVTGFSESPRRVSSRLYVIR